MKKPNAAPRLTPNQAALVNLGRALFRAEIQMAEQRGYIRRVHEIERLARVDAEQEAVERADPIAQLGRVLERSPMKVASQILDVMPADLLDKVLGKPDDGEAHDG